MWTSQPAHRATVDTPHVSRQKSREIFVWLGKPRPEPPPQPPPPRSWILELVKHMRKQRVHDEKSVKNDRFYKEACCAARVKRISSIYGICSNSREPTLFHGNTRCPLGSFQTRLPATAPWRFINAPVTCLPASSMTDFLAGMKISI
jgi:hypothetical protein